MFCLWHVDVLRVTVTPKTKQTNTSPGVYIRVCDGPLQVPFGLWQAWALPPFSLN